MKLQKKMKLNLYITIGLQGIVFCILEYGLYFDYNSEWILNKIARGQYAKIFWEISIVDVVLNFELKIVLIAFWL